MAILCYLAEWAARGELTRGEFYKITGFPIANTARRFWDNKIQIGVGSMVKMHAEWVGPGDLGGDRELPLAEGQSSGITLVGRSGIDAVTLHGPVRHMASTGTIPRTALAWLEATARLHGPIGNTEWIGHANAAFVWVSDTVWGTPSGWYHATGTHAYFDPRLIPPQDTWTSFGGSVWIDEPAPV